MKTSFCILVFLLVTFTAFSQSLSLETNTSKELLQQELNRLQPTDHGIAPQPFKGVPTQRLDSLVFTTYNSSTSQFENDVKRIYQYDPQYNRTVDDVYYWRPQLNDWEIHVMQAYEYNPDNLLLERTYYSQYDGSSSTFNFGENVQYTINNNLTTEAITTRLDTSTQSFENYKKETFNYDVSGLLTERFLSYWLNGQWELIGRFVSSYNGANQETERLEYQYNTGNWDLKGKTDYVYLNGLLTEVVSSNYSGNGWTPIIRYTHTYTPDDLVDETEAHFWIGGTWKPDSQWDENYDNVLNVSEEFVSDYSSSSQSWQWFSRETFTYDNSHAYADLITSFSEHDFRHQRLSSQTDRYEPISQQWFPKYEAAYYWTELISTSFEPVFAEGDSHSVYPNPVTDVLYLELPKTNQPAIVELYNASGQKVLQTNLKDRSVHVGGLPAGFYSYLIRLDGKVVNGKVIIQ